jgi:hypothetical protein
MMQKKLFYILFLIIAAFGCNKSEVDQLFDKTANERVSVLVDKYKTQLAASPFGWKGTYYPNGGVDGGYSFYLKFDIYGKLTMYSDVAGLMADQAFETSYQIKAFQKPLLIFDTYSYLHELVNPDYNGGTGQIADLELIIVSSADDKFVLKGNRNDTEMTLTKLSQNEYESVKKGELKNILKNTVDLTNSNTYTVINFANGEKADVFIDLNTKKLVVYYLSNKVVLNKEVAFYATPTGLTLKAPLSLLGANIQELIWDNATKTYYFTSGTSRINLVQSLRPGLPFYAALGTFFSAAVFDPTIPTQTEFYKTTYKEIKDKTISLSTTAPARVIGDVYFVYFKDDNAYALAFDYKRTYTDRVDEFTGILYYEPSFDAAGNIKFNRLQQTATATSDGLFSGISPIVNEGVKKFTDVIEKNTFNWDYDTVEPSTSVLKSVQTPSIQIKARLTN